MADLLPKRLLALSSGHKQYFSGKPCPKGHVANRLTVNGSCMECGRAKSRAAQAARRAANKDAVNAKKRENYAQNHEQYRKMLRAAYIRNRETHRAGSARWQSENPDKVAAYKHARRAAKRNSPGTLTAADIAEVRALQRGRCAMCRTTQSLTVDHIIPLARGGDHNRQNIQMLCTPCNSSKGAKHPIEFAQSRGLLL